MGLRSPDGRSIFTVKWLTDRWILLLFINLIVWMCCAARVTFNKREESLFDKLQKNISIFGFYIYIYSEREFSLFNMKCCLFIVELMVNGLDWQRCFLYISIRLNFVLNSEFKRTRRKREIVKYLRIYIIFEAAATTRSCVTLFIARCKFLVPNTHTFI